MKVLVSIRNEAGHKAEVQPQENGSFLLVENHSPITAAANACTQLCDAGLEVFQAGLGERVLVHRPEHGVAGFSPLLGDRCPNTLSLDSAEANAVREGWGR